MCSLTTPSVWAKTPDPPPGRANPRRCATFRTWKYASVRHRRVAVAMGCRSRAATTARSSLIFQPPESGVPEADCGADRQHPQGAMCCPKLRAAKPQAVIIATRLRSFAGTERTDSIGCEGITCAWCRCLRPTCSTKQDQAYKDSVLPKGKQARRGRGRRDRRLVQVCFWTAQWSAWTPSASPLRHRNCSSTSASRTENVVKQLRGRSVRDLTTLRRRRSKRSGQAKMWSRQSRACCKKF